MDIDKIIPISVPKNFLKIAPVYPKRADISNFSSIKIRDKSIGFSIVAISENLSSGYWLKKSREIRKIPSPLNCIYAKGKIDD